MVGDGQRVIYCGVKGGEVIWTNENRFLPWYIKESVMLLAQRME